MKHTLIISSLIAAPFFAAFASDSTEPVEASPECGAAPPTLARTAPPSSSLPAVFDQPQGLLSEKEIESLSLARQWIAAPEKPRITADGKVLYVYGSTIPTVFARKLHTSDIELEPGERVREGGVNVGDTVRWLIVPAVSGPETLPITHILIKPKDVGLTTTLVVATDRRTYHFLLKSTEEDWTPRLGFEYPENVEALWAKYQAQTARTIERETLPQTKQRISDLDFGYELKGSAPWKPVRVYNDGVKTYIDMPVEMQQTEAPVLLVIGADKKEQIVNYRLIGRRYIVDQVFAKAELKAGVGRRATRIVIIRDPQTP